MIEDVMNRNIEVMARSYAANRDAKPTLQVEQMYARAVNPNDPEAMARLARDFSGVGEKCRKVSRAIAEQMNSIIRWCTRLQCERRPMPGFFPCLRYDASKYCSGSVEGLVVRFSSAVWFFSLLIGWWSASKVMRPVSDLAARLRAYRGGTSEPKPLAAHFPDDEVGQLAEALDDYSARLTEVVQRDREFNADVSHELRTPLAVIRGATELLLTRPNLDEKKYCNACSASSAPNSNAAI